MNQTQSGPEAAAPAPAAAPKATKPAKRVKTPTVLQMEAVECGAAALAIILGYFHSFVPLEELRVACGVSRDGSKASNILKAARTYGLEAKGYRKEPKDLANMQGPLIIHWNFNHFLVFEGMKGNVVYLNDPAAGPRTVSIEEFDQSFTGVVLTFEPSSHYVRVGEKPSLYHALRKRLRGSEMALAFIVLAGLMLVIPGLVIPAFSKIFVDNVLLGRMHSWLGPLLIGMGLTALLRAMLTWMQRYYLLRMETKIALKTSSDFFWHVLRLPIEFFSQRHAGEIGSRVMLNDRVAQLLSGELAVAVLNCIMIVFYLILMLQYSWILTAVAVVTSLANVVFLRFMSRRQKDQSQKLMQDMGKMQGVSMGGLQMIETLKATGSESDFFAKWSGYQSNLMNAEQKIGVSRQVMGTIPSILSALTTALVLAIGGMQVLDGVLTIGMLVAFQSLMGSFTGPVAQLVMLAASLQEAESGMKRLDDVLKYAPDRRVDQEERPQEAMALAALETSVGAVETAGAAAVAAPEAAARAEQLQKRPLTDGKAKLAGFVELREVSFGYSKLEAPLIDKFSLTLKPGTRVALVGGSGSGKSTIAKMIAGLNEPWSGEIAFDGHTRDELPRSLISNSLAVVDQDIQMFEGTIRDNLSMWDATIPEADLIQAAKDACIHEEITARPGGYDHQIDEGGVNFSGGQRQRLEIARALAGNPSILVLDEATSALDPKTEQLVDDSFRRRGCTCIIVAHRLSTIRDADEIIVLERGKVKERGTHDELLQLGKSYARLIKEA